MNILFLSPYLSSPPRSGGQRRIHGLARELARRHSVSFLAFADVHGPRHELEESVRATKEYAETVETVPNPLWGAPGLRKRILQARAMGGLHTFEHIVSTLPAMQSALDRLLSGGRFDVLQVEFPYQAAYDFSAGGARTRLCLDEHNLEYDVLRRTAETDVGAVRRAYSMLTWRKLWLEERRAWRRFDGTVVTSVRDEELLRKDVPGARTAMVPNGVDVDTFVPTPNEAVDRNTVLFLGAINYYPNTDGLLFFLREAWPALKAARPGVKLKIVGPKPPPVISGWRDPDVEVTGFVDDVRPHIARAGAMLVPLRIGGGTRLKVLEAMAFGKPVVSTTLGAEGIDVTHEKDILIADDGRAFAAATARVLGDEALAARLGQAARELVVGKYSWRSAADRISEFHEELLAAPPRSKR
ncbi:MAG TPA: glycosyltransferase [Polyangiaceae bacterium]|nr:glycosyltransferase [Polyangiaceae bacterium]